MSKPELIMFVKFKSELAFEEAKEISESRIEQFRALPGLTQKYYFQDPSTGEYGGLYIWDSAESLEAFKNSELRASIGNAYQVIGEPRLELLKIFEVLRD